MNFEHDLEQLKNELGVISDLQAAAALLDWDMRTYMTSNPAPFSSPRSKRSLTPGPFRRNWDIGSTVWRPAVPPWIPIRMSAA